MVEQPGEDSAAAVERLRHELRVRPDNNELRVQLARALRRRTEESLAMTVYQVRVIASERQRRLCAETAAQILDLAPWDTDLQAFAIGLTGEVERGGRWTWVRKPLAYTLSACLIIAGLALAVVGGFTGDIPLIVMSGVLSSAALAGVVLLFRQQAWRVTAREVPLEYAGIS
jgi:hypothetical protein